MSRPVLTMYAMRGCSACAETKPHVDRIARDLGGRITTRVLDVDAVQVDFPILYTPTFSFVAPDGRRAVTDPVARGKDLTAEELVLWMRETLAKWAAGQPTE